MPKILPAPPPLSITVSSPFRFSMQLKTIGAAMCTSYCPFDFTVDIADVSPTKGTASTVSMMWHRSTANAIVGSDWIFASVFGDKALQAASVGAMKVHPSANWRQVFSTSAAVTCNSASLSTAVRKRALASRWLSTC
jgi:hypothetical protein